MFIDCRCYCHSSSVRSGIWPAQMPLLTELKSIIHRAAINIVLLTEREDLCRDNSVRLQA